MTLVQRAGVSVGAFTTDELRTGGRREGFVVEAGSGAGSFWRMSTCPAHPGWVGTVEEVGFFWEWFRTERST